MQSIIVYIIIHAQALVGSYRPRCSGWLEVDVSALTYEVSYAPFNPLTAALDSFILVLRQQDLFVCQLSTHSN